MPATEPAFRPDVSEVPIDVLTTLATLDHSRHTRNAVRHAQEVQEELR